MSDLSDLYLEVILDHNRRPRHWGHLAAPSHQARGANPLCGDALALTLQVKDGRIADIAFEGAGCAISKASASLMTDAVVGRTTDEARAIFERFHAMVTTPMSDPFEFDDLGKLAALAGVREFPIRVKCASLAWHTLKAALDGAAIASSE